MNIQRRHVTLFMFSINFIISSHIAAVDSQASSLSTESPDETTTSTESSKIEDEKINITCKTELLPGQYVCSQLPIINITSQQPINCRPNTKAVDAVECNATSHFICKETGNQTFYRDFDGCKWTNGYQFDTALLLSIFLGMFGVDRFYLGYPAIGLLKFSTLGFFFLGHLLDVVLIASQMLGPADGSNYVVSFFGPSITILSTNEGTQRRPEADWF